MYPQGNYVLSDATSGCASKNVIEDLYQAHMYVILQTAQTGQDLEDVKLARVWCKAAQQVLYSNSNLCICE